MRKSRRVAIAFAILVCAASPARAEEGMWTFDNFPAARMAAEMGWAPDRAWLDQVMVGAARLPGCSGANVSASGLVLTNQHCLIACLQELSTSQTNVLETGLSARTRMEERRCPNLSVSLLHSVADVTARIAAISAAPGEFARARNGEIARIEAECESLALRCEVAELYQGGRYALYRYRNYDDVRLVFVPEHAMAAFGGEADNFAFPRYCADFAFVRLYVNGAPAASPAHLSMRFAPLAEGDIVLTAGNPGATSRLKTAAELAFERDVNLPLQVASLAQTRERLATFSHLGPEQARTAAGALQGVENAHTVLAGRLRALASGFARITARENDLQARVRRNRAAQRDVGDSWAEIARAQSAYRGFFLAHYYLELRAGERSELFAWARDLVRAGAERVKSDAARLPRYAQARLASVALSLRTERGIDPAFEQVHLDVWLSALRAQLTDEQARYVFGGASAEALARSLSLSRLADRAYRMHLWNGGAAAIATSDDPMIAFVRSWDEDARAVRARYITEVEVPVARARERIAVARFRAFGESAYPEANFTPRVSYGRVLGWSEPERAVGAFTRVSGLYARAAAAAFPLSPSWSAARARLAPETQVNLAASNDIASGNSGSPLLDTEGRVVGVVFDGNAHALGGEYYYDGELNRAVSVAAPLIRDALTHVYGMAALVQELEAQ